LFVKANEKINWFGSNLGGLDWDLFRDLLGAGGVVGTGGVAAPLHFARLIHGGVIEASATRHRAQVMKKKWKKNAIK